MVEGQTIWIASVYHPFTIHYSFVYDSIDSQNQLRLTHFFQTPSEKYSHPMTVDNIQKGDVITLFGKNIRIINWDPWYIWVEYLNEDSLSHRKPIPIVIEDRMIDSTLFVAEMAKTANLFQDTSQIKELVMSRSKQHYLFRNLNETYKQALTQMANENYQSVYNELHALLEKKDLSFFGLIYLTALSALRLEYYDQAILYFQRLHDMVPQNPFGLYGVALTHYTRKDFTAAEAIIKRVVKTYPRWEFGYLLYAWILNAQQVSENQIKNEIKNSAEYRDNWKNHSSLYPTLDIYGFTIEELNKKK
ncbi:MAG: tetratricopeptide repeat protein [Candidatus Delongbacteria bacterium]|nr:tetratricopeptide repeat protein [Candidatus Delongbacteria bacterium]